jgi:hypothetical protein
MQLTTNTTAFIEAQQYSQFILMTLKDGLLPDTMYRNVSDFASGSTLNIKTVGMVTLQEAAEDTPLVYNPIETGTITLTINEYKGDAWYVTDDLREDGAQIETLMAQRAAESTRAFQEVYETDFLAMCETSQNLATSNDINGFAHRIVSAVANNIFALSHLVSMKLAFNKANVPAEGRIFICDGVVEATLNNLVTITHDVSPFGQSVLETGMARGQQFIQKLYGWDIITSNRLHQGASKSDGTTSITGVSNVFMCILDDQTKPIMGAIRRVPKVEGERNKDRARDEFVTRSRYTFGPQRLDTLGVLVTSPTAIA